MEERTLTCIECPRGCTLRVFEENCEVKVEGNFCPRGAAYGKNETVRPMRVVTGTVRTGKAVTAVKTDRPVAKSKIFEVMDAIHATHVEHSLAIGDVVIANVDGEGANIVATAPYAGTESGAAASCSVTKNV